MEIKGPDDKNFSFCGPIVAITKQTYSRKEWAWLCSSKSLFIKMGNGMDLAQGHCFPTPEVSQFTQ